jgi:hypothetical protein
MSVNMTSKDTIDPNILPSVVRALYLNEPSVRKLNLSNMSISDANLLRLADAITENWQLVDLDLSINHITHLSMQDFAAALTRNTSITILNLSENRIGHTGSTLLAPGLNSRFRHDTSRLTDITHQILLRCTPQDQNDNTMALSPVDAALYC